MSTTSEQSRLLGSPTPIEVDEILTGGRSELFRFYCPSDLDSSPHLFQVGRTVWARSKVCFESASISTRQGAFEVVGDELDGLLAHNVSSAQCQHRSVLLHLGLENLPHAGASAMQKNSLISTTDPESGTRFVVREALDVAQDDDLPLT